MLRNNPGAQIMPFDTRVHDAWLSRRDTVMSNAQTLAHYLGGGTDCAAPLRALNKRNRAPDLVIFVSDNESWRHQGDGRTTPMMVEWDKIKRRNPRAKLVCIDIAPYGTTQAKSRGDILNVGGFSDTVFDVIAGFANGQSGPAFWTDEIAKIQV
jgi:60 kDa SS-A/Ro ribonucleoprotein